MSELATVGDVAKVFRRSVKALRKVSGRNDLLITAIDKCPDETDAFLRSVAALLNAIVDAKPHSPARFDA